MEPEIVGNEKDREILGENTFRKGKKIIDALGLTPSPEDGERILFKGKEWLLVDGAITTREAYEKFEMSYAHLFEDGNIIRFQNKIGEEKDIAYLDRQNKIEMKP